jgi:uncharacterized protein YecT (DUF1311 family)
MQILAAGLLLALSAAPALAIDNYVPFEVAEADVGLVYSRTYADCMAASGGVTSVMQDCIGVEYDRLEPRLDVAYVEALDRASDPAEFTRRHIAWFAEGNLVCLEHGAEAGGGTASDLVTRSCVLRERIRRIVWLEQLAD